MSEWDRSAEARSFAGASFATGAAPGKVRDGFPTGTVCGVLLAIRFLTPAFSVLIGAIFHKPAQRYLTRCPNPLQRLLQRTRIEKRVASRFEMMTVKASIAFLLRPTKPLNRGDHRCCSVSVVLSLDK
ncbi:MULTISPECIES: hypothetical protein [unclassified Bradyrhizobium]|uniref:hypothetical protein n=1 Tax=unclassified Bradyrhizobium TaxID=2631580 RepID=UPI0033916365